LRKLKYFAHQEKETGNNEVKCRYMATKHPQAESNGKKNSKTIVIQPMGYHKVFVLQLLNALLLIQSLLQGTRIGLSMFESLF
jgi:hypothetical protein